jgi:hypothetical protein
MMENLLAEDGLTMDFQLVVDLPKLNFVKLEPREYAFTQIHDPRQTYESLNNIFSCFHLVLKWLSANSRPSR